MLTQALALPLTILQAMIKVKGLDWVCCTDHVSFHIVGVEQDDVLVSYAELFRLLPALRTIDVFFIGPEMRPDLKVFADNDGNKVPDDHPGQVNP